MQQSALPASARVKPSQADSGSATFRLRLPEREIVRWAKRWVENDGQFISVVRPAVHARGFLTRSEFLEICKWKTRRSQSKCARNDERAVRTITCAAFATPDEVLKMDLLRLLHGVEWPTASTLLHFCDTRPYPILDYRALWSLGIANPPHYTMGFWLEYLNYTRRLALKLQVPIRTVDRGLWQYSKERQP
jgi:hypothetical protein